MFVLVELRDTVTIAPSQFHRKMQDAVTYALNKKFANKVRNAYYYMWYTAIVSTAYKAWIAKAIS